MMRSYKEKRRRQHACVGGVDRAAVKSSRPYRKKVMRVGSSLAGCGCSGGGDASPPGGEANAAKRDARATRVHRATPAHARRVTAIKQAAPQMLRLCCNTREKRPEVVWQSAPWRKCASSRSWAA